MSLEQPTLCARESVLNPVMVDFGSQCVPVDAFWARALDLGID